MARLLFLVAIFFIGFGLFAPLLGIIPFTWLGLVFNVIFAILSIAMANILGNQEEILGKLDQLDDRQRLIPTQKKECTRCNHSYELDYISCPNCGYKQ